MQDEQRQHDRRHAAGQVEDGDGHAEPAQRLVPPDVDEAVAGIAEERSGGGHLGLRVAHADHAERGQPEHRRPTANSASGPPPSATRDAAIGGPKIVATT